LADIAENWRSRANENGIRVASSEGDADDEGMLSLSLSLRMDLLMGGNSERANTFVKG
jgi:hypothetical protein